MNLEHRIRHFLWIHAQDQTVACCLYIPNARQLKESNILKAILNFTVV